MDAASAVIGILGPFDTDDLEAALVGRVLRHELRRRLPDAEIRLFAPYGWERPTRLDGGEPAEPLGPWSHERAAELAGRLDVAVVLAAEGDDERLAWLQPGGLDDGLTAVEWAPREPHLALLADELIAADTLHKRLRFLRLMGWWPDDGPVTIVEGDPGRLLARSPSGEYELPPELSIEDVLAAVAVAEDADLRSPVLVEARRAHHEPPAEDRARLDLWFDGLLAALDKATAGQAQARARAAEARLAGLQARLAALEEAYEARGRRLVEERLVFADHVDALQREFEITRAEVVTARERAATAQAEADLRRRADELRAAADAELAAIKASRSWRWTRPLRAAAHRLARRRP